ncbi:MAG: hypothetical protein AAF236_13500 [Verrucomicrobiota bacterium]
MPQRPGLQILITLEQKLGGLALPGILRWIVGFQLLSGALALFASEEFVQWIVFHRESIFQGQVWRLVSWVFYPIIAPLSFTSLLFILITVLFCFFISDGLEAEWGVFRVNMFIIACIVCLAVAGVLIPTALSITSLSYLLFCSVFFAFATIYPDQVIHLFGVIPIKAKWLGVAKAALLVALIVSTKPLVSNIAFTATGLLPYFIVFLPGFFAAARSASETKVRRHRYEASQFNEAEAFHTCTTCGATELSHPERQFRVNSDGEERCEQCL